jgi:cytochrome P450
MLSDPVAFLLETTEEHGDPFVLRLGGPKPMWSTAHPDGIRAIFTAPTDVLTSGGPTHVLFPFVGARSVMMVQGVEHRRRRKWMMPPFHGARMRSYGTIIQEAARRAVAGWSTGETVEALAATECMTLEVIVRAVYGAEGERVVPHVDAVVSVLEAMTPWVVFFKFLQRDLGPWSPWGRYLRRADAADRLLQAEIDRRRAEPDVAREDILSMLLSARDEDGQGMDDTDLRDQLVTVLAAGHITTAVSLSWALHFVHADGDVLDRLRDELDGAGDAPEEVAALPYLTAVCKEALRLIPAVPLVARTAQKPFTLMGRPVAPGERVAAHIVLAHRRPEAFADPHAFRPERFLDRKPGAFEFIPFGGGVRRCIGEALALYEMKLGLAAILRIVELESAEPGTPAITRRNLTLAPKTGARLRVLARRSD